MIFQIEGLNGNLNKQSSKSLFLYIYFNIALTSSFKENFVNNIDMKAWRENREINAFAQNDHFKWSPNRSSGTSACLSPVHRVLNRQLHTRYSQWRFDSSGASGSTNNRKMNAQLLKYQLSVSSTSAPNIPRVIGNLAANILLKWYIYLYLSSEILLTKATVYFRIGMHWNTVIDLLKNVALQVLKESFNLVVIHLNKMIMNESMNQWTNH